MFDPVELLFEQPAKANPAELVFGEVDLLPDRTVAVDLVLPGPVVAFHISARYRELTIDASLPGPTVAFQLQYVSGTDRPVVGQARTPHQDARACEVGMAHGFGQSVRTPVCAQSWFGQAGAAHASVQAGSQDGKRLRSGYAARHADALRLPAARVRDSYGDMLRTARNSLSTSWQDADARRTGIFTLWQDRCRDRRPTVQSRWQNGKPIEVGTSHASRVGRQLVWGRKARWQDAMRPPPRGYVPPTVVPPAHVCYTPRLPAELIFQFTSSSPGLLFVCDGKATPDPVVVPVRKVYIVMNNVALVRVDGAVPLKALSLSMSLDGDSWAWRFNARLHGSSLAAVLPSTPGQPVELEATINGVPYRLLAEEIERERVFPEMTVAISGRGKAAVLEDPYSTIRTFENAAEDRTALQLMAEALTNNGIPLGWDIDWNLVDWLVPAGAWSFQGTYVGALARIASAAGGYLQPHDTDDVVRVLSRYPVAPWDWADDVSPDVTLPADVALVENIKLMTKPAYNRVFVSGQGAGGRRAQVTRTGTDGRILAPMVVEALNTHVDAGRQRGRVILSDTGAQELVSLRLPVLESTGVIKPGTYVEYHDGTTVRLGLSRSTTVDYSGMPYLWQTIGVETHA